MSGHLSELSALRPRSVCIIKPSSLGDIVHALPVIAALRTAWPTARISWVVNRGLRGLLDGLPELDEVIPFDRQKVGLSPAGLLRFGGFLRELKARRFDLTLDLQGLLRSGVMTRATGAPIRVGLASAREGATRFYTHRIDVPESTTHAVDRLMEVVRSFGIAASPTFRPAISDADREWADTTLRGLARPRLVANLGARWVTKRLPPETFAEVARRAREHFGASIIVVGAPEDAESVRRFLEVLAAGDVLDLCGRTRLSQLAAVFEASDCVISNDTGPLHLAAATGVRVVGAYTCTSPEKTGPYGSNAVAVQSGIWCAGSCIKVCPRLECMTELTADRIWPEVFKSLEASQKRKAS